MFNHFLLVFFSVPLLFFFKNMEMPLEQGRWPGRRRPGCAASALGRVGETWQPASPAVGVAAPEAVLATPDLPFS